MTRDSDVPPISFDSGVLRRVLLRAINRNQLLLLTQIEANRSQTLTGLLQRLSGTCGVPLSTLKLNARILRDLSLIDIEIGGNSRTPTLTIEGRVVLEIISNGGDKSEFS